MHTSLTSLNPFTFAAPVAETAAHVYYQRTIEVLNEGSLGFGITDDKGRKVGYKWKIQRYTYAPRTDGQLHGYTPPKDGSMAQYAIETWTTRDGERYGPASNDILSADLECARAQLDKRLENARKANKKKFAA